MSGSGDAHPSPPKSDGGRWKLKRRQLGSCPVAIGMFGDLLLQERRDLQDRAPRPVGSRGRRGRRRHRGKGRAASVRRGVPLALLPIGTANNVAHSLELLGEAEEIAANLQGAPMRPLDLGSAKGPWGERRFIEAIGIGATAPALKRSDPKPPFEHRIRLGREALCEAIAAAAPHRIALTVDGENLDGEFLLVEVLNLRFSGPRLPIAYFAEPGDQVLDIVLLCEDQRQTMLDWVRAAPEETAGLGAYRPQVDDGLGWRAIAARRSRLPARGRSTSHRNRARAEQPSRSLPLSLAVAREAWAWDFPVQ